MTPPPIDVQEQRYKHAVELQQSFRRHERASVKRLDLSHLTYAELSDALKSAEVHLYNSFTASTTIKHCTSATYRMIRFREAAVRAIRDVLIASTTETPKSIPSDEDDFRNVAEEQMFSNFEKGGHCARLEAMRTPRPYISDWPISDLERPLQEAQTQLYDMFLIESQGSSGHTCSLDELQRIRHAEGAVRAARKIIAEWAKREVSQ